MNDDPDNVVNSKYYIIIQTHKSNLMIKNS